MILAILLILLTCSPAIAGMNNTIVAGVTGYALGAASSSGDSYIETTPNSNPCWIKLTGYWPNTEWSDFNQIIDARRIISFSDNDGITRVNLGYDSIRVRESPAGIINMINQTCKAH